MKIMVKHNGAFQPTEVLHPRLDEWILAVPDPLALLNTETGDLEPRWLYPEYPELSEDEDLGDDVMVISWRSYEDFLNAVGL